MSKYGIELTREQYKTVEGYIRKKYPNHPDLDPYFWLAWNGVCEILEDDKLENGFTETEFCSATEKAVNTIDEFLKKLEEKE